TAPRDHAWRPPPRGDAPPATAGSPPFVRKASEPAPSLPDRTCHPSRPVPRAKCRVRRRSSPPVKLAQTTANQLADYGVFLPDSQRPARSERARSFAARKRAFILAGLPPRARRAVQLRSAAKLAAASRWLSSA